MKNFDFTPFFRHSVGFDHLLDLLDTSQEVAYPPYNIERLAENDYRITLAVAGFKQDEITLEAEGNALKIKGAKQEEAKVDYLHKGIATRGFERVFQLADFVEVRDAKLADGLLHIDLNRVVPDAQKPRKITINSNAPELLESEV